MSSYKSFTPGSKSSMRAYMNKVYLMQYYGVTSGDIVSGECTCIKPTYNKGKQGWNDQTQTENVRISKAITGTLGGRITYGNLNKPATVNYLGGWEGQPGGTRGPLRNKF